MTTVAQQQDQRPKAAPNSLEFLGAAPLIRAVSNARCCSPLIPDPDSRTAVDEIAFTPAFLADLGKVQTGEKRDYVRIWTYGPKKPTRIDFQNGPTVVLVPVNVAGVDTESWGAV